MSKVTIYTSAMIRAYEAANPMPHRKVQEAWETEAREARKREARRLLRESQALRYRSIGL